MRVLGWPPNFRLPSYRLYRNGRWRSLPNTAQRASIMGSPRSSTFEPPKGSAIGGYLWGLEIFSTPHATPHTVSKAGKSLIFNRWHGTFSPPRSPMTLLSCSKAIDDHYGSLQKAFAPPVMKTGARQAITAIKAEPGTKFHGGYAVHRHLNPRLLSSFTEGLRCVNEDISFPGVSMSDPEARMSSLEIAELTGKLHKNVLADIRRMLTELGLQPADFSARYRDEKGEVRTCAQLPKRETMILMTGYSVPMRAAVVDRWAELEAKLQAPPSMSQQTEQLLAPIMAPLAAMSQMLQTLVQLNTAQLQQAPARAKRSQESFRPTKPVTEKRRTEPKVTIQEDQDWYETGRLGRKPTFVREDVSAVLTLAKKGVTSNNIAKALNLSIYVVKHIRMNPVWAEGVLRRWGL